MEAWSLGERGGCCGGAKLVGDEELVKGKVERGVCEGLELGLEGGDALLNIGIKRQQIGLR